MVIKCNLESLWRKEKSICEIESENIYPLKPIEEPKLIQISNDIVPAKINLENVTFEKSENVTLGKTKIPNLEK